MNDIEQRKYHWIFRSQFIAHVYTFVVCLLVCVVFFSLLLIQWNAFAWIATELKNVYHQIKEEEFNKKK